MKANEGESLLTDTLFQVGRERQGTTGNDRKRQETTPPTANRRWLNKNVFAFGMASLFSDMGHEMATALLPVFLTATLRAPAWALGVIEGVADVAASAFKLLAGWHTDRIGKRKPLTVLGYLATGLATGGYALAQVWQHVLVAKTLGWMGRGTRGPLRDAMMAESVTPNFYGRAFGFHRAMDTLGAILGPAAAALLLHELPARRIFVISLVPGVLAAAFIAGLVKEKHRPPHHGLKLWGSVKQLPARFKRFVAAVGVFGLGNFSHTLLILRAMEVLKPTMGTVHANAMAIGLYTFHNVVYSAAAFPAGVLSERFGKRALLGVGYFLFALMCVGFSLPTLTLPRLVVLFLLAGLYIGIVDTMEGAFAAELLPDERRGTGNGLLHTVNGVGDLVSSVVVGFLWTAISPVFGFGYAAVMSGVGGLLLLRLRR
jgi:MFS family permease